MHKSVHLTIIIFLFFILTTCKNTNIIKLYINNKLFYAEVADNPQKRERGLSDRKYLKQDHGMLFVFDKVDKQSFWMYHCYIDLDIGYFNSEGILLEYLTMKKEPYNTPSSLLPLYDSSSYNVKFALEMNKGWFIDNNISIGDKLILSNFFNN